MRIFFTTLLTLIVLSSGRVPAKEIALPPPGPTDTCPVCGMFVAKYPDWIATVLYKDGHTHHFDGAKDMFKYLSDLRKWAPGHNREEIKAIGVTEYYSVQRIDAKSAWYVTGSDVMGPMGHELIPLATKGDAEGFLRDHAAKRIMRFEDVSPALLKRLDEGSFD